MATKFTLQPKPTFKANVTIPRAGDEDGVLTFTFNHKPLKELADLEKLEGKTATDFLMEIISGWALPDAFNAENLSVLLQNYPAAMKAIPETYYRELMGQREKN
ncbi:phage tail assembly chaperone [Enterobacter sp. WI-ESBL-E8]